MRTVVMYGLMGVALLLGACSGRLANPEPVDWPYDRYYSCKDIHAEKVRIAQAMQDRGVEQASRRQSDNDLMSRTIPFLPVGLAAVDQSRMSGSAKTPQEVEIEALKARDAHLDSMAADRGC